MHRRIALHHRPQNVRSTEQTASHNWRVMLSKALQRNAKHEARFSNISGPNLGLAEK
jgi:hypothetical protein